MTIIDTANALLKDKEDEKPSREEAENAVKVLIEWAGDDPTREGLIETPKRVVKAFEEYFSGYSKNPKNILEKTFFETGNYQEFVLLKNHHLVLNNNISLLKSIEEASNFVGEFIPVKNFKNDKYVGSINEADLFQAYLDLQNQVIFEEKDTNK